MERRATRATLLAAVASLSQISVEGLPILYGHNTFECRGNRDEDTINVPLSSTNTAMIRHVLVRSKFLMLPEVTSIITSSNFYSNLDSLSVASLALSDYFGTTNGRTGYRHTFSGDESAGFVSTSSHSMSFNIINN